MPITRMIAPVTTGGNSGSSRLMKGAALMPKIPAEITERQQARGWQDLIARMNDFNTHEPVPSGAGLRPAYQATVPRAARFPRDGPMARTLLSI